MAKEIGKDANAKEDAAKAKYTSTFRDIYDKVPHKTYSAHGDETTSSEHCKIFIADDGRLEQKRMYICHFGDWDNPD